MSKTGQAKKKTAIKLPPLKNPNPRLMKETDKKIDDDDDDDFICVASKPKPNPKLVKPSGLASKADYKIKEEKLKKKVVVIKPSSPSSKDNDTGTTIVETQSGYFKVKPTNKEDGNVKNNDKERIASKTNVKVEDRLVDEIKETKVKVPEKESEPEEASRVVCPFCWKNLRDKLTGATHVKSCGKNLPTEKLFEALELHEKQVKEWEKMGIAYPGFGAKTAGSKPKPRSKKKDKIDGDMELAMALSMSLHEEIESRKRKERKFLVDNGFSDEEVDVPKTVDGKEAEFVLKGKKVPQNQKKESCRVRLPKMNQRGAKKVVIEDSKLKNTTDEARQHITNERVCKILEQKPVNFVEYVRDAPTLPECVPRKLKSYHNEQSSPLWKASQVDEDDDINIDTPQTFTVQAVKECKERVEKEFLEKYPVVVISEKEEKDASKVAKLKDVSPKTLTTARAHTTDSNTLTSVVTVPRPQKACDTSVKSRKSKSNMSKRSVGSRSEKFEMYLKEDCIKNLPVLVRDILNLLIHRKHVDVTLYARDEIPIRCHLLVLRGSCPTMLDEIAEVNQHGQVFSVVALSHFCHEAVVAFVWFLYTGCFKPQGRSAVALEDIAELTKKYKVDLNIQGSLCGDVQEADLKPTKMGSNVHSQTETNTYEDRETQTEEPTTQPDDHLEHSVRSDDECCDLEMNVFENSFGDNSFVHNEANDSVHSADDLFNEESPQVNAIDRSPSPVVKHDEKSPSVILIESSSEDEDARSRDMFEDDEFDLQELDQVEKQEEIKVAGIHKDETKTEKQHGSTTSFKRSRSFTSVSFDEEGSMTATQLAHWIEAGMHLKYTTKGSSDTEEYQAKKKHKLDIIGGNIIEDEPEVVTIGSESDAETEKMSNNDVNEFDDDLLDLSNDDIPFARSFSQPNTSTFTVQNNSTPKLVFSQLPASNFDISFSNLSSSLCKTPVASTSVKSTPRTNKAGHVSPIPISTSSPNSPNHSFPNPQQSYNTTTYVCDWGNNDTYFATIPDPILDLPEPVEANDPEIFGQAQTQSKGRGRGRSKKTKDTAPALTQKSKSKPKEKQRPISLSQNNITPTNPSQSQRGRRNEHTPMLNYSTLDTPLLKNELKKYGLKPLPRSKAKKLLRHIYDETHKEEGVAN